MMIVLLQTFLFYKIKTIKYYDDEIFFIIGWIVPVSREEETVAGSTRDTVSSWARPLWSKFFSNFWVSILLEKRPSKFWPTGRKKYYSSFKLIILIYILADKKRTYWLFGSWWKEPTVSPVTLVSSKISLYFLPLIPVGQFNQWSIKQLKYFHFFFHYFVNRNMKSIRSKN